MDTHALTRSLAALAARFVPGARGIDGLRLLTGGASMQTWAFDAVGEGASTPLILRHNPGEEEDADLAADLAIEASLMASADAAGVPVARIVWVSGPSDPIRNAIVMARLQGETLGTRIVRDAAFAPARDLLTAQCGTALAAIHRVMPDPPRPLERRDPAEALAHYRQIWDRDPMPRAAIEAAFRWLADTVPEPVSPCLVHGDFRVGNLMVDPEQGLVGVLDWELAHLGDPAEDLGWLCVNSWRFRRPDREVGGFGHLPALIEAYESAGGMRMSPDRVRWWQAMGTLNWAVTTRSLFLAGGGSVERAVIGRRLSECEADLVALMSQP